MTDWKQKALALEAKVKQAKERRSQINRRYHERSIKDAGLCEDCGGCCNKYSLRCKECSGRRTGHNLAVEKWHG